MTFSNFCRFVLPERVDEVAATPPFLRFGDPVYGTRLTQEIAVVESCGFWSQLCFAAEVVRLAALEPRVPHVCRGSAGSSLLCYLVGISDIDPVASGIAFVRFLGGGRDKPPDVDLDFPSDLRPVVWERIRARYGDRVGFVATPLKYRSQGALREALRRCGIPHDVWISPYAVVSQESRDRVGQIASRLEGTQFGVARHCGGLVVFPGVVPADVRTARAKDPFFQMRLDKDSLGTHGKLDVLSNKALSHLGALGVDIRSVPAEDAGAARLFSSGDTWGIVQGESPAMRKLFLTLGVTSREGVVLALGLVRPATGGGKQGGVGRNPLERMLVYEDDVSEFLGVILGCAPSVAEYSRRVLGKGGVEAAGLLSEVESAMGRRGRVDFRGRSMTWSQVREALGFARGFAFCKAHATAYGHLVWALGVAKAADPRAFWEGFLNTAMPSSMYLPWVHFERMKSELGVEVLWPGDAGLRPGRFFSRRWCIAGGKVAVSGAPVSGLLPLSFPEPGLWLRQLASAGFWAGTASPITGTWANLGTSRAQFRGLNGLRSVRVHPLGDGRQCVFATLGYGMGGVVEYNRIFRAGPLPSGVAGMGFTLGEGRVRRLGSSAYVTTEVV